MLVVVPILCPAQAEGQRTAPLGVSATGELLTVDGSVVHDLAFGPRPTGRDRAAGTLVPVPVVVVDVVLKPEISDPQGQAVLGALGRLGHSGVRSVRQGKHFVLDVEGEPDEAELREIAETLLANPVIEDVELHLPTD